VTLFLYAHGERPRDVLFGGQPAVREAAHGVPLILVALGIAAAVLLGVQHWAPSLHMVAQNPLEQMLGRPRDIWLFALVSIVAGGIREETQRAFLLHRFEVWLGGGTVGLVVTSVAFGFAISSRAWTPRWPRRCSARSGAWFTCGGDRRWHRWSATPGSTCCRSFR
jgi:membrane protease YdiL (CAAX protease family)